MAKNMHEVRDPIHIFIRLDSYERKVLDSLLSKGFGISISSGCRTSSTPAQHIKGSSIL